MPMTAEQYFKQLCSEAGMDEATTTALIAAANNEKLSPKMNELIRRATDDFSAMQGRATASERKLGEYENWYKTADEQYRTAMAELEQYRQAVNTGNQIPQIDTSKYLTKEDLLKFNQDRDARYSQVIKEGLRLASRHAVKFNEELDVDALEKLATESGLPLSAAYDKWIQPRIEEKQKNEWEQKLKLAREEGAKDALSRHKLPVDPVPQEQSLIHHRPPADSIPKDIDSELLAAWNGAGRQ